jgi:hypothetical protein
LEDVEIRLMNKPITIRSRGLEPKSMLPVHHDVDDLAGTWTEEEAADFAIATEGFRQVDPELWGEEILEDFPL